MAASTLKLSNNAIALLSSNITAGQTTISLQSGKGALFPVLTGGRWHMATLIRSSDLAIEIVKVTARSGDTLTVVRGQEGTAALAFLAGDRIELRLTAGTLEGEYARIDEGLGAAETHINRTDNPHGVSKEQIGLGSVQNYDVASQAEAEAGTADNKYMTPQRTAQAIAQLAPASPVSSVNGKTGAVVLAKGDVGLGNVQNYPVASQAEAVAGALNDRYMTPLRVREAIQAGGTAGMTAQAIGSLALLAYNSASAAISANGQYAGGNLRYWSPHTPPAGGAVGSFLNGSAIAGTWRALGTTNGQTNNVNIQLFVRIA